MFNTPFADSIFDSVITHLILPFVNCKIVLCQTKLTFALSKYDIKLGVTYQHFILFFM